jgi:hypothetical protein
MDATIEPTVCYDTWWDLIAESCAEEWGCDVGRAHQILAADNTEELPVEQSDNDPIPSKWQLWISEADLSEGLLREVDEAECAVSIPAPQHLIISSDRDFEEDFLTALDAVPVEYKDGVAYLQVNYDFAGHAGTAAVQMDADPAVERRLIAERLREIRSTWEVV